MKKFMLMFMLVASMSTAAMAQRPSQKKSVQPKAQTAMVQTLDESYFDDYNLTSAQQKKVRALNSKYKKKARTQNQQKYNSELKKVLSSSQYNQYTGKKSSKKSSKSYKKQQKKQPKKSSKQLKRNKPELD